MLETEWLSLIAIRASLLISGAGKFCFLGPYRILTQVVSAGACFSLLRMRCYP